MSDEFHPVAGTGQRDEIRDLFYAQIGFDRHPQPVRSFQTFTEDLHRLDDCYNTTGSKPSRWNPLESSGFRCSRSWNSVASRYAWSMRVM
jgi:hypothetical protein